MREMNCKYCHSIVFLGYDEPDLDGCWYFCDKRCFKEYENEKEFERKKEK